jgi:hypothetical protein
MIFIRRDAALIPSSILAVAARAQAKLNGLPPGERVALHVNLDKMPELRKETFTA